MRLDEGLLGWQEFLGICIAKAGLCDKNSVVCPFVMSTRLLKLWNSIFSEDWAPKRAETAEGTAAIHLKDVNSRHCYLICARGRPLVGKVA